MNLHLEKGRPNDVGNRLPKEIRVYELLDQLEVEYDRVDHEALFTMEACIEVDELLNTMICKNLFLCNTQQTIFYLLMLPGYKKFKTRDISNQLGVARLSFAPEHYMEELLDITPGSVSVMGLMNDKEGKISLLIDRDILNSENFGCHPCINTTSLRMRVSDLIEKFLPATGHSYQVVTAMEESVVG